jgi:hypothetical protein
VDSAGKVSSVNLASKSLILLCPAVHRDATDDVDATNSAPRLLNRVASLKSEGQLARSSSG